LNQYGRRQKDLTKREDHGGELRTNRRVIISLNNHFHRQRFGLFSAPGCLALGDDAAYQRKKRKLRSLITH
jgi:hypothetical protein